jgi:ribosomal protein S18 acetylase RimI-like enzyme
MPTAISLHDKATIAAFFLRNPTIHFYAIGDLDDFFWPYTNWYALQDGDTIRQIILAYTGAPTLILHAITDGPLDEMRTLLQRIMHLLPPRLYVHLSGDLITVFEADYAIEPHGMHDKMALVEPTKLDSVDSAAVMQLTAEDHEQISALYEASYPGNWFDTRMLETGHYYGLRESGELLSIAGIHVYSPRYRIAGLGNITTHPKARRRGYAARVTAKLCQELLRTVDHIGLGVKSDNTGAIACYTKLGFTRVGQYHEYALELRRGNRE